MGISPTGLPFHTLSLPFLVVFKKRMALEKPDVYTFSLDFLMNNVVSFDFFLTDF